MSSVWLRPQDGYPLLKAVVNSTSATIALVAGSGANIVRLYRAILVFGGAGNITFEDGSTALSGPMPFAANAVLILPMDGNEWFKTSAGNALNIANASTVQVSGTIYYTTGNA